MADKYYKLAWSGNIFRSILDDFNHDVAKAEGITNPSAGPWGTEYGDFNGDGKLDILTSYWEGNHGGEYYAGQAPSQLVLLLSDGKNGFKDGSYLLPNHGRLTDGMATKYAVGDFNNDGIDDFAVASRNEDGRSDFDPDTYYCQQHYYLSHNGKFVRHDMGFVTSGRTVVAADFNNDGLDDFMDFGWLPNKDGMTSTFMLQDGHGGFDQLWSDGPGANFVCAGDFDGDGELELSDIVPKTVSGKLYWVTRVWEMNDDGTMTSLDDDPNAVRWVWYPAGVRTEPGVGWDGRHDVFQIGVDQDGHEFIDDGYHFGVSGDITGDGTDDIVAVHLASKMKYIHGVLHGGVPINHLDLFTGGPDGMELSDHRINGWPSTIPGNLEDIHLVDFDGDGHLDIFIQADIKNKQGLDEGAEVYLNDGIGNFNRLNQKFIPSGDNPNFDFYSDYIDANGDGIMDMLVRPEGFTPGYNKWGRYSEKLYLGTARIFGTDTTHNPAINGAAGFNAAYYQDEVAAHHMKIKGHMTALEHYLSVGKDKGLWGFATGTHVYGYDGNDTITLREGNETAEGLGGNDKLTGGAGADTLSGGTGNDTFVYLAATDSGITDETRDIINDFKHGTDLIDLAGIDAKPSSDADDKFDLIGQAAFTGQEGQLRWSMENTSDFKGILVEGDITGDGVADFQIALHGSKTIDEHDFAL